jgi:Cys-tRNA(Pro) deacylase
MNSADLQYFIDSHHVQATILLMDQHTPTVPEAAKALGVEAWQIIKSLVFLVKDEPVLVINNGQARIDPRKLADYLAVGRGRIKFAAPDQALEITGYVVGSMPPFGHKQKLRTVIDTSIGSLETIYGGGGDINAMMRLTAAELLRVTSAEAARISE